MYTNSAYYNNSLADFIDKTKPLVVASCGTYHLYSQPELVTKRPKGRVDYQLLYIASGKAHFTFEKEGEMLITAGQMVLYRPQEMQHYIYYGKDQTEVYWIHFTGNQVEEILKQYHFPADGNILYSGTSPEYQQLFRKIIQELQLCKPHYEDFCAMLLQQLFLAVDRQIREDKKMNGYAQKEAEHATHYFYEHYNKNLSIEDYAASRNMSTCWFIRTFKQYSGLTPLHYILSIRISNAQSLLENTNYTVTEIASIVGYDNPLYFSRLFRKQTGLSPTEYRKQSIDSRLL